MNKNVWKGARAAGWLVRGFPAYSLNAKDMRKRTRNGLSALVGFKDACITAWSVACELWSESGRVSERDVVTNDTRSRYSNNKDMLFVKKADLIAWLHTILWVLALTFFVAGAIGVFLDFGVRLGGIRFGAGFLLFLSLLLTGFNLLVVSYFVMMNRRKIFVPYVVFLSCLRRLDSSAWAPKVGV